MKREIVNHDCLHADLPDFASVMEKFRKEAEILAIGHFALFSDSELILRMNNPPPEDRNYCNLTGKHTHVELKSE